MHPANGSGTELQAAYREDARRRAGCRDYRLARQHWFEVDRSKTLSSNDRYRAGFVCFADIPSADMRVHTAKYGAFGISFAKRFLVAQGASPVLYVERNSLSHVRRDDIPSGVHSNFAPAMYWSRAEFYDQVDAALDAELGLSEGTPADDGSDSAARRGLIREFLLRHVLPYLKFFDSGLADEHVDNFYMEREWRVPGVVTFRLRDVERIWVPRTWRERLRIDLPDYDGQISFL